MKEIKIHTAKSLGARIKGLIGENSAKPLLIKTRFGIHTFGLKFSIDVLVLDGSLKVIKMKRNLAPNSVFLWNPKYSQVLELPAGDISKYSINLGDNLKLIH